MTRWMLAAVLAFAAPLIASADDAPKKEPVLPKKAADAEEKKPDEKKADAEASGPKVAHIKLSGDLELGHAARETGTHYVERALGLLASDSRGVDLELILLDAQLLNEVFGDHKF